jgi:hypothetical protein
LGLLPAAALAKQPPKPLLLVLPAPFCSLLLLLLN